MNTRIKKLLKSLPERMLAKKSELGREKSEISRIQNFSMTSTRMDKGLLK
jgi:hypothetical protein